MFQKIVPFLWFDTEAEAAATLYTSLFEGSRILDVSRYPGGGPGEPGKVMTVSFELAGQRFTALNGGPEYHFTEAISLFVECEDQAETDRLWNALIADGGQEGRCGWLKDRFGLSWQIIPKALMQLMGDPDPRRGGAVMQAMLKMQKIEVPVLQSAWEHATDQA